MMAIGTIPFKDYRLVKRYIIRAASLGAHAVEFRVDYWNFEEPPKIRQFVNLARTYGMEVIVTVRDPSEGGVSKKSWKDEFLKEADSLNCICDVEAKLYNHLPCRKTILSVHYFKHMKSPDFTEVKELSKKSALLGADIFKVAAVLKTERELLKLKSSINHPRPAFMPMGLGSERLRLITPLLGSALIYGSIGESTAPGQVSLLDALTAVELASKYIS